MIIQLQNALNLLVDEGIKTEDATAVESDILINKTAYVKGKKITGNLKIQKCYVLSSIPDVSLGEEGDLFLVVEEAAS